MKQALIKKTGEIFDVVSEYSMMKLTFNLPFDFPDKENFEKEITETWIHNGGTQVKMKTEKDREEYYILSNGETYEVKMKTEKDREEYYILSNGETYEVDHLVIGLDEIRDWKLENKLNL